MPGRIRRKLHLKKQKERSELKFCNSSVRVREHALYSLAAADDVKVLAVSVRKRDLARYIEGNSDEFYKSLCGTLVEYLPLASVAPGRISLVFDARRGTRAKGIEFDARMVDGVQTGYRRIGLIEPEVTVSRFDSLNSGGLQMADFAAGAIHRWHESMDDEYRKMIESKIVLDVLCGESPTVGNKECRPWPDC